MENQNFSSVLIKSRYKLDLTQLEVASKVGVSQSAYNYWESGKHYPTLRVAGLLLTVLQIPHDVFIQTIMEEKARKKK
ncbi:MAG: hypothetical protein RIR51_286 [Bacteroidota bacterium]|jgi:transcriptional regulator with XRE-family HTH domain